MNGSTLSWSFAGFDFGHGTSDESIQEHKHAEFLECVDGDLLFVCWSQVIFKVQDRLVVKGYLSGIVDFPAGSAASFFGDHNGYFGLVDTRGGLHLADVTCYGSTLPPALHSVASIDDGPITTVVVAGNDCIAVAHRFYVENGNTSVDEYTNLQHLRAHLDSLTPDDEATKPQTIVLPVQITHVVANTGVFVALTASGRVITWGDTRYHGLGRKPGESEEDFQISAEKPHTPRKIATRPGYVDSLGGINIVKIAAGGWLWAAVSADNDIYICCPSTPGPGTRLAEVLNKDTEPGELAMVTIPDERGQPLDLVDVAVGESFVLVRTSQGQVFGIGNNKHGELGCGSDAEFVDTWTMVCSGGVRAIAAGPNCSLVVR